MNRLEHDTDHKVTNLLISFLMGMICGIGLFAVLLLYLDTTNTDIAVLNEPSPRATCHSMQKLGFDIWLCTRHNKK